MEKKSKCICKSKSNFKCFYCSTSSIQSEENHVDKIVKAIKNRFEEIREQLDKQEKEAIAQAIKNGIESGIPTSQPNSEEKGCCKKCRGHKSEARGVLNRCEYVLCPCHSPKPEEKCEGNDECGGTALFGKCPFHNKVTHTSDECPTCKRPYEL